ncbi:MAG: PDZ domain-containing protein [Akkermansiaceae bacterium]|nr:PDZ domain-containing protein [Akkermansiaceae bacterium]
MVFPATAGGRATNATAVPLPGDSTLVSVIAGGADARNPTLRVGSQVVPVQIIGHDPVSRLGFYRIDGQPTPKSMDWLESAGNSAGATLQAMGPAGSVKCRSTGWVKQVGGKILPLALLSVTFDRTVPPPGTPLLDSAGRVAAILFQASGSGTVGYAIPAEAVHRVRRDVSNGGQLVRGWLGLSLRAENQSPQIVRVLPQSPAAKAGILPGDVLTAVGTRTITDYADAANAFFYLIPGETVRVKLLRGVEPMEFPLTPISPQAE